MPNPPTPLAITGLGLASSLGGAVAGIAAARAGIARSRALDEQVFDPSANEAVPVLGHEVVTARGFEGAGRYCVLVDAALRDLAQQAESEPVQHVTLLLSDGTLFAAATRRGMLADEDPSASVDEIVQEAELARRADLRARVVPFVAERVGCTPAAIDVVHGGRAALIGALADLAPGPRLVICVDSLLDPPALRALTELGLCKGPEHPAGTIPGEAAVALRVDVPAHGAVCITAANVRDGASGRFSGEPPDGRTLASVVARATAAFPRAGAALSRAIGSLNGDPWQAMEWGTALVGCPPIVRTLPLWSPAQAFGETGVCGAALGVACAATALRRGYGAGAALVWALADDGQCGALVVADRAAIN